MSKPTAHGRDLAMSTRRLLYFWDDRALYIGQGLPATVHAHQAIQVCIPLSGTLRLRPGPSAPWQHYAAAVIPADQPHESDVAVDLLATFWLDPACVEARRLGRCQAEHPIIPLQGPGLAGLLPRFVACWEECWEPGAAASLLSEVLRPIAGGRQPEIGIDRRVARVVEIVRSNRYRRGWLQELAAAVSLSPSRLEHLFTFEIGLPLRRYVLWQRLRLAAQELAAGASVTETAHASGFSDTAHLSRTFRRMLGFTPSSAFERTAPAAWLRLLPGTYRGP